MPSSGFENLKRFLLEQMRMSALYQPVMLHTLLHHGGQASIPEIASRFLAHDQSQLDYYAHITTQMPGPVLRRHGIVEKRGSSYQLTPEYRPESPEERDELMALCEAAVEAYKAKRGAALFAHRAVDLSPIPGKAYYEAIQRAGTRCEACGVSAQERALQVDHIRPRSKGGSNEPENLQVLCYVCNQAKGAGDDTDFGRVQSSYNDREPGCVFCELPSSRIVAENSLAVVIRDGFPVTPLHMLGIPRRHVVDYFDLYQSERNAIEQLLHEARTAVLAEDSSVEGFNVGINAGKVAGQTVFHCHIHLIPRRKGDVQNPAGGVRHVIPHRGAYSL